jgi:glycosyltransferase involved in cell wall biosynthesis
MVEASVVICAYTLERWDQLKAAVDSVVAQTRPAREIFVVIDNNEGLRVTATREISGAKVVPNMLTPGLSGGRMTGARLASAPVVAFLDDDAIAEPDWLEELLAAYRDERALGAGGLIEPLWAAKPPRWFPHEFHWVIGCTYSGMPIRDGRIRNVIGANMSVRADVLHRTGGFTTRLGRRTGGALTKGIAESCEETEFCIRAARLYPEGYWAYRPRARVRHRVSAQRMTWHYFVRRCRMEGTAKAVLITIAGGRDGLASERRYIFSLLRSFLRELASALRGEGHAVLRAGAIFAGLAITATAYLRARLGWLPHATRSASP